MRPYVHEQLLEARRRTLLHCRVARRTPTEDQQADKQPSGAMAVVAAVGAGLCATALLLWSWWWPRVAAWLR